MKRCTACDTWLGAEMFSRDRSRADGLQKRCKKCIAAYHRENRQEINERERSRYRSDVEKERGRKREYFQKNRAAIMARKKLHKRTSRELSAKQKATRCANEAARRAKKSQATPAWADRVAIKWIYSEARRVSAESGVLHHVDHVVPLKGVGVCGLHVPWNLQIIPWRENIVKKNKY